MNFKWDKKYLYWGVTAFLVLASAILFYYFVFHNAQFLQIFKNIINICFPVIDGLIIAFLLCPLINWFEQKVFILFRKKEKRSEPVSEKAAKWLRVLSILLSYVIVISLLTAFIITVIPQIKESITNIYAQSSQYKANIENWLNDLFEKYPDIEVWVMDSFDTYAAQFSEWKNNYLLPKVQELLATVSTGVFNFFSALWDILIGAIVSIYVLFSKEKFSGQFKKLAYGFLNTKTANVLISNIRMVNHKFSGFIVGKLLDSLVIGILCFVGCSIFGFDYPVLLGLIIGVTNIIPFFGPFIGAIPCILLLFMINPLHSLYFAIFILALQQFDGNILGPAILGESTGISSFWVIFSITLFGGLWGVTGMIVGVPLFAVFYAIIKTILTTKLSKKELPTETCKYVSVDYINTETNEFIDLLPESVKAKELKEKRRLQKEEKKAKYKALFAKKKEETSKQETSEDDSKKD
ncbi:MAG: AI-2E family transporter [Lachnospiraceae bacterium]|nr:AI-2E family transporter [Lachnospiraceae bacterium]